MAHGSEPVSSREMVDGAQGGPRIWLTRTGEGGYALRECVQARVVALAAQAVARLQPQVRWATVADKAEAKALEDAVLSVLLNLWNRRLAGGTGKVRQGGARPVNGTKADYHVGGGGVREIVRAQMNGAGYVDGDPEAAEAWSEQVVLAWLDVVRSDPIMDLAERVKASLPGQGRVVGPTLERWIASPMPVE